MISAVVVAISVAIGCHADFRTRNGHGLVVEYRRVGIHDWWLEGLPLGIV